MNDSRRHATEPRDILHRLTARKHRNQQRQANQARLAFVRRFYAVVTDSEPYAVLVSCDDVSELVSDRKPCPSGRNPFVNPHHSNCADYHGVTVDRVQFTPQDPPTLIACDPFNRNRNAQTIRVAIPSINNSLYTP